MNCPNHPRNEVTGYCTVCGAFGCPECLTEHEGGLLCRKHYRPIAKRIEEEKKHERQRKKPARQRLVVRYKDGRIQRGVCYALNPKESGFHLDLVDDVGVTFGETEHIRFKELKAVFYVKSFDGKFDKALRYREWQPEGSELVVEFDDGEVIRGHTLRIYDPDEPRFFLVPASPRTNNISILVERSAAVGVYTTEEFEASRAERRKARKEEEAAAGLSREETMGDFYFETRNYDAAYEQYALAEKQFPHSLRLRRKKLTAQYNVGVQHIKRHEYKDALACMENILQLDGRNSHALKKRAQLRRVIEKEERGEAVEGGS